MEINPVSECTSVSIFAAINYLSNTYRMRAIITRGWYVLNPFFESQKRFLKGFLANQLTLIQPGGRLGPPHYY